MSPSDPSLAPPRSILAAGLVSLLVLATVWSGVAVAPGGPPGSDSRALVGGERAGGPVGMEGGPTTAAAPGTVADDGQGAPRITGVYPNPVADGDAGEFVLVAPGGANLSAYALTDGERRVALPAVEGPVALTAAPERVRDLTDHRAVRVPVALANGGERLRLVAANGTGGRAASVVRYDDAPEGEVYRRAPGATGWDWRPLGRTDLPVVEAGGASATAFVLPDAPAVPVETLREADERLLLAGYTFGSPRVADALIRARERGIRVRVLLEGDPVGGTTRRQARLLDRLTDAGVAVRVVGGPHARYEYHHAKYAVVDDRALVLTENWKPAGTGGAASRGWGALVDDPELAAGLARTFRADAGWVDAVPWRRFRRGRSFEAIPPANGSFGGQFAPERLPVERARLLVAPDNAASEVVALLDGAEESIRVVGPTLGTDGRFLPALLRAARRGVRVQVLLSGTWYARAENERLAERLRERADAEDLPLTVRLAEPRGYAKIHAKGAVIDGRRVVLGSLNWNRHAATENREVVVVLSGERVAGYYARVFDADWGGGGSPLPVGVIAALGLAVLVALVVLRTVEFGGEAGPGAEGSQDGRPPPGV